MTINIPYPLLSTHQLRAAPDMELEHRLWLADRIHEAGGRERLGAGFVRIDLASAIGAPGPSVAVFVFESLPGIPVNDQVRFRIPLVLNFVEHAAQ
jgi:hypothetical protein